MSPSTPPADTVVQSVRGNGRGVEGERVESSVPDSFILIPHLWHSDPKIPQSTPETPDPPGRPGPAVWAGLSQSQVCVCVGSISAVVSTDVSSRSCSWNCTLSVINSQRCLINNRLILCVQDHAAVIQSGVLKITRQLLFALNHIMDLYN